MDVENLLKFTAGSNAVITWDSPRLSSAVTETLVRDNVGISKDTERTEIPWYPELRTNIGVDAWTEKFWFRIRYSVNWIP